MAASQDQGQTNSAWPLIQEMYVALVPEADDAVAAAETHDHAAAETQGNVSAGTQDPEGISE